MGSLANIPPSKPLLSHEERARSKDLQSKTVKSNVSSVLANPGKDLVIIDGVQLDMDLGGFEAEDFSALSDWSTMMRPGDKYAIVFKMGIKTGLKDKDDREITVICYFGSVVGLGGRAVTEEIYNEKLKDLGSVMTKMSKKMVTYFGNAMCVILPMPEYMQRDLKSIIDKKYGR